MAVASVYAVSALPVWGHQRPERLLAPVGPAAQDLVAVHGRGILGGRVPAERHSAVHDLGPEVSGSRGLGLVLLLGLILVLGLGRKTRAGQGDGHGREREDEPA